MIEITPNYVFYETGELWLAAQSFACHPTARYKFPINSEDNTQLYQYFLDYYSLPLDVTRLSLDYNKDFDTLRPTMGFLMGTILHRLAAS